MTDPDSTVVIDPSPGRARPRFPSPGPGWSRELWTMLAAVLVFAAAVGAGVAVAVGAGTPTYRSTAALLIDDPRAIATSNDAGVIAKLSALRIKYVDLLSTDALTSQIAAAAGMSPDQAAGAVFGSAPAGDLLLIVSADAASSGRSTRLAAAAADVARAYAQQDQAVAGVPPAQRYTLTLVSPATSAVRIAPSTGRAAAAGAIAAVLAVVVAAAASAAWWWRRARRDEDLRARFDA